MQPENSHTTAPGFEQMQMPPAIGPEGVPNLPPINSNIERGQERFEQAAESGAAVADATAHATAAAAPQALVAHSSSPQPDGVASASTPLVAADEDLIEKEWVDKAKQIVGQTQGDPHARTEKVNELQRDYLQKRYGKVVGAGN